MNRLGESCEPLCVVMSSYPGYANEKLLAVQKLRHATGIAQVESVFDALECKRSGVVVSVSFAVGRPGVYSPCRVIPKDFKQSYLQLPYLALGI